MRRALALALALAASPALAVEPGERLADPALEARARVLSAGLRCVVCRNESIDESNAELASEMRVLVRERLLAGDSDAEAVAWLVDRYGEYVLLEPTREGVNRILWAAPLALALGGLAVAGAHVARQRRSGPDRLDPAEEARVRALLDEGGGR